MNILNFTMDVNPVQNPVYEIKLFSDEDQIFVDRELTIVPIYIGFEKIRNATFSFDYKTVKEINNDISEIPTIENTFYLTTEITSRSQTSIMIQ